MRIRRGIIIVTLVCGFVAWLLHSVDPADTWQGLMNGWGIADREQFTILTVLAAALIGFTLVLRILRDTKED